MAGKTSEQRASLDDYRGHVSVGLHGKKLRGGYSLTRMRRGGRQAWLLVKKADALLSPRRPPPEGGPAGTAAAANGSSWPIRRPPHHAVPRPRHYPARGPALPGGQACAGHRCTHHRPFGKKDL
jgi:hypothetical protein